MLALFIPREVAVLDDSTTMAAAAAAAAEAKTSSSAPIVVRQFLVERARLWSSYSYKRILQLTPTSILTLNPDTMEVTNTFAYANVVSVCASKSDMETFSIEVNSRLFDESKAALSYIYRTQHRTLLLCHLLQMQMKMHVLESVSSFGPFHALRGRKSGARAECQIEFAPYGIKELDAFTGRTMQLYYYHNIRALGNATYYILRLRALSKYFTSTLTEMLLMLPMASNTR